MILWGKRLRNRSSEVAFLGDERKFPDLFEVLYLDPQRNALDGGFFLHKTAPKKAWHLEGPGSTSGVFAPRRFAKVG